MNEEVDLARTILDNKKAHVETAELVVWRREKVERQRANPARLHPHAGHAAAKTARTQSRQRGQQEGFHSETRWRPVREQQPRSAQGLHTDCEDSNCLKLL